MGASHSPRARAGPVPWMRGVRDPRFRQGSLAWTHCFREVLLMTAQVSDRGAPLFPQTPREGVREARWIPEVFPPPPPPPPRPRGGVGGGGGGLGTRGGGGWGAGWGGGGDAPRGSSSLWRARLCKVQEVVLGWCAWGGGRSRWGAGPAAGAGGPRPRGWVGDIPGCGCPQGGLCMHWSTPLTLACCAASPATRPDSRTWRASPGAPDCCDWRAVRVGSRPPPPAAPRAAWSEHSTVLVRARVLSQRRAQRLEPRA